MARNRLLYLVVLVATTVFYGFFYGWFSEFLWYLTLIMPLLSLLLSLPAMLTLRAELDTPGKLNRGQEAGAVLTLRCKYPAPRCKFRVQIVHTPSGVARTYKFRSKTSCTDTYTLPTDHSGAVHYDLSRAKVCDYLGLFALSRQWEHQGTTIVLPCPAPPEKLPNLTQLMSAAFRPKPGGGFSEIHELREYRPGDSLRHIHWKLTAKTDNPVVREPQELCIGTVALSLDLPTEPERFDMVLDRVVWLSGWLLERGYGHQVVWFSGTKPTGCNISTGEDIQELVRLLCLSSPAEEGCFATSLCAGASWHYHVTPGADKLREEGTEP